MKILLAEDEAQLNRVITVALEREGYNVDSVFNGQDAVEKATTNHYHLMIFDIMMPIKLESKPSKKSASWAIRPTLSC